MADLRWYARRLGAMTPGEVAGRVRDSLEAQRLRRVRLEERASTGQPSRSPRKASGNPRDAVADIAREDLIASADRVMAGEWDALGSTRKDLSPTPDWFLDPVSGTVAPSAGNAFGIDQRDPELVGDAKQVWELSRHHHLTVLAAAFYFTEDERYAFRIRDHLEDWWTQNPFLQGTHWTSGIELGMRLLAWVWVDRLLGTWNGRAELFEDNGRFLDQLYGHQVFLDRLPARGSSANNHLIAESAGLFAAACAFPLFEESERWRVIGAERLEAALARQTYPSGLNRELASEYHTYVLELAVLAGVEGDMAGHPLDGTYWRRITAMFDALVGTLDARRQPPRQGDGDDAVGLLVDGATFDRYPSLVATGTGLVGAAPWWPEFSEVDVRTALLTEWVPASSGRAHPRRPATRPVHEPDAGLTLLLADANTPDEIWIRMEGGPLGYMKTAAHGHADALAIELRVGGAELLADPGTFVYQGEPGWREHFRSTRAHSTLELGGVSQAESAGPFLWYHHPATHVGTVAGLHEGDPATWRATHTGYERLPQRAVHERAVTLNRRARSIAITDTVTVAGDGAVPARLTFQLGPEIECSLTPRGDALLRWRAERGVERTATMGLSRKMRWRTGRGESDPIEGWYSPSFGSKKPATVLIGETEIGVGVTLLRTDIRLDDVGHGGIRSDAGQAVDGGSS